MKEVGVDRNLLVLLYPIELARLSFHLLQHRQRCGFGIRKWVVVVVSSLPSAIIAIDFDGIGRTSSRKR